MPFIKQSYISFAIPKLYEAKQFSKILSKSLDPTVGILSNQHRWARLLNQQSWITVYRLPTQENQLLFSGSVFRKQTEVLVFPFFVCNKQTEVAVFRSFRCSRVPRKWISGIPRKLEFFGISFYIRGIPRNSKCKISRNTAEFRRKNDTEF